MLRVNKPHKPGHETQDKGSEEGKGEGNGERLKFSGVSEKQRVKPMRLMFLTKTAVKVEIFFFYRGSAMEKSTIISNRQTAKPHTVC